MKPIAEALKGRRGFPLPKIESMDRIEKNARG